MFTSFQIFIGSLLLFSTQADMHEGTGTDYSSEAIAHTNIHTSSLYWLHLWEERLRDEHSHVENRLISEEEYAEEREKLFFEFQSRYTVESYRQSLQRIGNLYQEGILSEKDVQMYQKSMNVYATKVLD